MRALILVACSALALAACRNSDQSDNVTNADQGLTAESIVSNDVTAIDAVTGADANMAADVNYLPEPTTGSGGNSATASPTTTTRPGRPATGSTAPVSTLTLSAEFRWNMLGIPHNDFHVFDGSVLPGYVDGNIVIPEEVNPFCEKCGWF